MIQQIYTTPTPFSGTNISIPNSGKGYTSNMIIKGQTYQNLVNGNPYYAGANTSLFHWELSENDSKITIKRTQQGDIDWQYVGVPININLLKNDTTYTVMFFASGKCENVNAYINVMEGSAINSVGGGRVPRISGINKYKFTTDHNTKLQNQILYIGMSKTELPNVNDYMTLSNFVLLEGDWTNKEVPSSITGIESVGDKENNKISILSHGKNLFNMQMFGDTVKPFIPDINSVHWVNKGVKAWQSINTWNNYTKLKPNTLYGIKCDLVIHDNKGKGGFYIRGTNNAVIPCSESGSSGWFVTPADGLVCLGLRGTWSDATEIDIEFNNITLVEFNSIPETKEEKQAFANSIVLEKPKADKKEISLPIEGGLKSLPNGVADTIEQRDNGVYLVQRISKITLDGSQDESFTPPRQYGTAYRYDFNIDNMKLGNTHVLLCNNLEIGVISTNDLQCVNLHSTSTLLQIQVLNVNTIDAFRKWLQTDPLTVYYELATPIETKLDINNINLQTFKDLTYVISENNIEPVLEFKAPILGYKTINPIQLKTTQDGTEVNVYPYSTPELITFGDNETLADKMNNIENTHTHNNATVTTDGFMSKESYSKLESLTNYAHPSTHAATMITEDSTHRFITDTERNNWNAKASTNIATPSTNGLMSNTDKQKIDRISNNFDIVYDANTETIRFRFR